MVEIEIIKAKKVGIDYENGQYLTIEKVQELAEFEAHIRKGIEQFEDGLGKTFKDKDEFMIYLRNL